MKFFQFLWLWLFIALGTIAQAQTMHTPAQVVIGCAYNSSPIVGTSGLYATVQCDSLGKLLTGSSSSSVITNPTSILTRPNDTNAYASGDLIASSTTAGSVVVPSFSIANSAGGAIIPRIRLSTSATTGWGTTLTLTFWTAAPTYTNGDNDAYAVATGAAGFIGTMSCTLTQYGDGASGACQPNVNNAFVVKLSGASVYWDVQATAAVTPIANQTFTLTAEVLN